MAEGEGKENLSSLETKQGFIESVFRTIEDGRSPYLYLGIDFADCVIPFAAVTSKWGLKIKEREDLIERAQGLADKVPENDLGRVTNAYFLEGWGEGNVCVACVAFKSERRKGDGTLITFLESPTTKFN